MILDLDIGNSRVKWRLTSDGEALEAGALPFGCYQWQNLPVKPDSLKRIRAANVAGDEKKRTLLNWAKKYCDIVPEFAQTQPLQAGVTCGYQHHDKLGVDRWLAIIAAYHRRKNACVVVGAGTALTVDFVDANGYHLGGYITPGLRLMQQQLFANTSDVKIDALGSDKTEPGTSTPEAVQHGCLRMALDFVQGCRKRFGEHHPSLILTGGDAPLLAADFEQAERVPYLVLDGLALVLDSPKTDGGE